MADKEININIKTTADNQPVVELTTHMQELHDSAEEVSESLENVGETVGEISGEAFTELNDSAVDANDSLADYIDSVNEGTEGLDELASMADNVASATDSISPGPIQELGDEANKASDSFGNLIDSIENAGDSATLMDAMFASEMSGELVSGYMDMAGAAGSYNDTMVRLGYALDKTSLSVEEAEAKYGSMISTMTKETGRGAGNARNHLINLGNAGITNSQILQDSFNGVSKAAFQMNQPFETLDSKFQQVVLTGMAGKRQLRAFGLSVEDLAKTMGVSADEVSDSFKNMDENTRASILSTTLNMKYGADVTENYKNSYEHLNEQLDRAKDYFIRSVGAALLPIVIPALQTGADLINKFTEGFRALPAPIQNGIAAFLSLSVGLTALSTGFSLAAKFIGFALTPYMKLINFFGGSLGTLRTVASMIKTVGLEVLTAGYNALRSAAMWVYEKTAKLASAIASKAAAAAQWLLNIAMDANPIMIVVLAIIALIAILGYLYFNNEQVRQSIDGLWASLVAFGQSAYLILESFVNSAISALENFWNYIQTLGGLLPESVSITGNNIVDGVIGVMIFIATLPLQLSMIFINIIAKTLGFGNKFVQNMISAGSRSVSNFVSWISQLPGRLATELNNMLSAVGRWAATLPQKFWEAGVNAVKNFLNALGIHSPGTMQTMMVWEITEMARRTPIEGRKLLSNISDLGSNVVSSFGNPNIDFSFNGSGTISDMNVENTINQNTDLNRILNLLTDIMKSLGNNGDTVININGDVDSDRRVQQIIDVIQRELHWNNKTAGRTV